MRSGRAVGRLTWLRKTTALNILGGIHRLPDVCKEHNSKKAPSHRTASPIALETTVFVLSH